MARSLAALIAATLTPLVAVAEPRAAISFEAALGLAHDLPALSAQREVAGEERALAHDLPRAWQPLTLTLSPQGRLAPRDDRGLEGAVAVQQLIPFADNTGARRAVLEAQAATRLAATAAGTLDSRLDAAAAWIGAWVAHEHVATATREYALARDIVTITERGAAAGVFTAPETADARAFLAEADLRISDAEGTLAEARLHLARSLARRDAVDAVGALPDVPLPPADARGRLLEHAQALPVVAARRLAARAARARAAEERATRGRQLIVGAEVFRDGPGALVGGVTVGLSLPHDRGQREAREAGLAARTAEAEAEQLVAGAVADLATVLHEVEHTAEVLTKLRDGLVPAAEAAAARRQRALDVGETTVVELLASQRTALAARARLAEARAAHAWARVRAWLLLEAAGTAS